MFGRLLQSSIGPVFQRRGEFFEVFLLDGAPWMDHMCQVVESEVRPWKELLPKVMTLDNAYMPRKGEEEKIPHSFLFRRRDCGLVFVD